jgi:hypothetical protein
MKISTYTCALALAAFLSLTTQFASAQGSISGKLWVVSPSQASDVTFPPPSATPDATFTTNGIAYIGQNSTHCYTIGSWLNTCGTPAFGLAFSGLPNPNLHNMTAKTGTKMSGTNYGVIAEFTGTVNLTNGQGISIIHDDGVSLMIDGVAVSGFDSFITAPILETVTFTGTTGPHSIDLLYANAAGNPATNGAWLLFVPQLF